MRPFAASNYRTPVLHVPRVVEREDADEVESWPGAGTELRCNASQGPPRERWTQSIEESLTAWTLWFSYAAIVEAGVTIRRGDQMRIAQEHAPPLVLRVSADPVDWNQRHVSWCVVASQVS